MIVFMLSSKIVKYKNPIKSCLQNVETTSFFML